MLGACKKFSLMNVNIPAADLAELYARLTPSGEVRGDVDAMDDRTEERRKMIDAFSNASDVWEVTLDVKASRLVGGCVSEVRSTGGTIRQYCIDEIKIPKPLELSSFTYQGNDTFISANLNSNNSN